MLLLVALQIKVIEDQLSCLSGKRTTTIGILPRNVSSSQRQPTGASLWNTY